MIKMAPPIPFPKNVSEIYQICHPGKRTSWDCGRNDRNISNNVLNANSNEHHYRKLDARNFFCNIFCYVGKRNCETSQLISADTRYWGHDIPFNKFPPAIKMRQSGNSAF